MKSKELKTYNLPNENTMLSEINAKPTVLFVLLILVGIISLILRISPIYGITLITIGVVAIIAMPRVTLMEFYYDYLVMYNRADKNTCAIIYYSEVKSWYYSWSAKKDILTIELEDGSVEQIEAFSKTIFEAHMSRYLKDKHKKNK